jgi:predicted nucleotidyltransferase
MTLLQKMNAERREAREQLRDRTRSRLREALREFLPGSPVYVFGSLAAPGRFSEHSDIDIALDREPVSPNHYELVALLSELGSR